MALRMQNEEMEKQKKIVKLNYNPYYIRTTAEFENVATERLTKTLEILKLNENEILQSWIDKFLENLFLELNTDSLEVIFEGRETDYQDIEEILEKYPAAKLGHSKRYQDENLKANFLNGIEDFKKIIKEYKLNIDISKYPKFFTGEVKVAVMAPMSSGKSTFLNAIIGSELLPAENAACTSRIFEIINNKNLKEGEFEYRVVINSEPIFNWTKVTQSNLKELNESGLPENSKIEIAGNIPFLSNENYNIRLIDTPGPNNNNNNDHRLESLDFIKNEKDCIVIYVLDSTNLTTNDSGVYIEEIARFLNENEEKKHLSEKIIFVLNKFDDLSVARGEDKKILQEAIIFLKNKGIKNPKIFPISSLLVKSLRRGIKNINEDEMDDITYEEWETYQSIESKFIKSRSKMNTLDFVPLSESLKERWNSEEDINKRLENISGVTAIEYYIHRHINRYHIVRKTNNILEKILADINAEYQKLSLIIKNDEAVIKKMKDSELSKSKKMDEIKLFIRNLDINKNLSQIDHAYTKHLYSPFIEMKRDIKEKHGETIKEKEAKKLYDEIEKHLTVKSDQFKSDLKGIYNELKDNVEVEVEKKLKNHIEDFNYKKVFDNFLLDLKIGIDEKKLERITKNNEVKFKISESNTWITLLWNQIKVDNFLTSIENNTTANIKEHENKTKQLFEKEINRFKEECNSCVENIFEKISASIKELDIKDKNVQKLKKTENELLGLKNKIENIVG